MTEADKPDVPDTKAASHITDHAFIPGQRGWWDRCGYEPSDGQICGIAESAHQETTLKPEDRMAGSPRAVPASTEEPRTEVEEPAREPEPEESVHGRSNAQA